jgi:hypothetical protein
MRCKRSKQEKQTNKQTMAKHFESVDDFTFYAHSQDSKYPIKASREQYTRIWVRLNKFNGVVDYTTLDYRYYLKPKSYYLKRREFRPRKKHTVVNSSILAEGIKQGKLGYINGDMTLRRRQERAINCIESGTRTLDDYDEQWLRGSIPLTKEEKTKTPPIPAPRYTRPENLPPPPPELINDNWFLPDF